MAIKKSSSRSGACIWISELASAVAPSGQVTWLLAGASFTPLACFTAAAIFVAAGAGLLVLPDWLPEAEAEREAVG
jgi:hypothetical protein